MVTGCCIRSSACRTGTVAIGWEVPSGSPRRLAGLVFGRWAHHIARSGHHPHSVCPSTIRVRMVTGDDHHDELCRCHPSQG